MPDISPGRSDVHVNRPLTNISLAFTQSADAFVADKVFPNIPVSKQSDQYYTYPRGEWNRDDMEERTPGAESAGGSYTLSTDTYLAVTRALHKDVPDQVRANQDDPINLDREAVEYVTHKAMLNREINWQTKYFPATHAPGGVWTFDVDGASSASASFDPTDAGNNDKVYWNDGSSTPIEDVREGKRYVQETSGQRPNVLVLGRPVFDVLLDHPDIVGRIDRGQTSGAAIANREALAALFEVEEILVMDAIYNSAKQGATNVHAFIGGKNALLAYRPSTPGLMTPSAGYTFSWTGLMGSTPNGMRIKRFRMEHIESDRIEIQASYDQKVIAPDLGYYFGGIVE